MTPREIADLTKTIMPNCEIVLQDKESNALNYKWYWEMRANYKGSLALHIYAADDFEKIRMRIFQNNATVLKIDTHMCDFEREFSRLRRLNKIALRNSIEVWY